TAIAFQPVWRDASSAARMALSPMSLEIGSRPPSPTNKLHLVEPVLDAVRAGSRITFGKESFDTEAQFLWVMSQVLLELPPELRGHISFASGFARHEHGLQVVWMPDRVLETPRESLNQPPSYQGAVQLIHTPSKELSSTRKGRKLV